MVWLRTAWRQSRVFPINRNIPWAPAYGLHCSNCRAVPRCPRCLQCTHIPQEEVMYAVITWGQHWLNFQQGPQGKWSFIWNIIQEASHNENSHHHHRVESIPSLQPSSHFHLLRISFQEDNVDGHGQAGHRHSDVKPRPDYCSWELKICWAKTAQVSYKQIK